MWGVAGGLELLAVAVDFADSGRVKWLYVGPAAYCVAMAFRAWSTRHRSLRLG
jgi:hypothetical protein